MAFFTVFAEIAKNQAFKYANTDTTAAMIEAIAATTDTTVFTIYRCLSVLSLEAGVSTSWLNLSTPGM